MIGQSTTKMSATPLSWPKITNDIGATTNNTDSLGKDVNFDFHFHSPCWS